ncbi:hypothetical protein LAZ67_5004241 [Cordylochernes scorpioides]|uniref:Uncharacterized protein n=1 Tax=Cordylochernes scorpioides TaxID=51811 RepID=A0ABY6KHT3_9ARAC|nr:hypothetical protein LAZ67_5004241 [Cordylochernes scorpioides]
MCYCYSEKFEPKQGLCNSTRMLIQFMCSHVLEAQTLTETKVGHTVSISAFPSFKRGASFDFFMTINKAQCQSVAIVSLLLQEPIGSEKEQRWRNKPTIPTKRPSNLFPKIFTEETPSQGTSADPLTPIANAGSKLTAPTTAPKFPQVMETEQRCAQTL